MKKKTTQPTKEITPQPIGRALCETMTIEEYKKRFLTKAVLEAEADAELVRRMNEMELEE